MVLGGHRRQALIVGAADESRHKNREYHQRRSRQEGWDGPMVRENRPGGEPL